jgi:hypothetical protein
MYGTSMRHFFDFGRAAGGAGDEHFRGLLLKVLIARKPALETVLFFAEEIIDDHGISLRGLRFKAPSYSLSRVRESRV